MQKSDSTLGNTSTNKTNQERLHKMKKSELQQGTAYLVTSRDVSGYSSSIYKVVEWNRRERKYIIFEDGEVTSPYKTPSMVYVTSCPTYGHDCKTHNEINANGFRRSCPRDKARLMDIKGEFYPLMADYARRYAERNADGGRGAQYLRHTQRKAQREREAIAKPIEAEMYRAINAITGADLGTYWNNLSRLNLEQMKALTEALNATRKVGA